MTSQKIHKLCETLDVLCAGRPDTAEIREMLKQVPMWSQDSKMLSALEMAGIDNWDGFSQAQEIYDQT